MFLTAFMEKSYSLPVKFVLDMRYGRLQVLAVIYRFEKFA